MSNKLVTEDYVNNLLGNKCTLYTYVINSNGDVSINDSKNRIANVLINSSTNYSVYIQFVNRFKYGLSIVNMNNNSNSIYSTTSPNLNNAMHVNHYAVNADGTISKMPPPQFTLVILEFNEL